jgi:hypothetical protein
MKKSFEQYFLERGVEHYSYDEVDFEQYKQARHPGLDRLIKIYGNPFPNESKDVIKLIKEEEKHLKASKPTGMAQVEV